MEFNSDMDRACEECSYGCDSGTGCDCAAGEDDCVADYAVFAAVNPDPEQEHARDLFALEEEIRAKRQSLKSRILYEHCVQVKRLGDKIHELEKECGESEAKYSADKENVQIENRMNESRLEMLQKGHKKRREDIEAAHNGELERMKDFKKVLEKDVADVRDRVPDVTKQLKELQAGSGQASQKGHDSLEAELRSTREKVFEQREYNKEELLEMEREQESRSNDMDEKLLDLQEDLDRHLHQLKSLGHELADEVDEYKYSTKILQQKICQAKDEAELSVDEDRLKSEIKYFEENATDDTDRIQTTLDEGASVRSQLMDTLKKKLANHKSKFESEKAGLEKKLSQLESTLDDLQTAKKNLPLQIQAALDGLKEEFDEEAGRLEGIRSCQQKQHQEKMDAYQGENGKLEQGLLDEMSDLEKSEEAMTAAHEEAMSALQQEVDRHMNSGIPKLEELLEQINAKSGCRIGELHAEIEANRFRTENMRQAADNLKEDFDEDMKKFQQHAETSHDDHWEDIRGREEELEDLRKQHEELLENLKEEEDHSNENIVPLRRDVDLLRCVLQELEEQLSKYQQMQREEPTEHDKALDVIRAAMEDANQSHMGEKTRLEDIMVKEKEDHDLAAHELKKTIEMARERLVEMLNRHKEEKATAIRQLQEKQELIEVTGNQEIKVQGLQKQIEEVEKQLRHVERLHEKELHRTKKRQEHTIEQLKREKDHVDAKYRKSEKMVGHIGDLQQMLSDVEEGLDQIKDEEIQQHDNSDMLVKERDRIERANRRLEAKLRNLSDKCGQLDSITGRQLVNLGQLRKAEEIKAPKFKTPNTKGCATVSEKEVPAENNITLKNKMSEIWHDFECSSTEKSEETENNCCEERTRLPLTGTVPEKGCADSDSTQSTEKMCSTSATSETIDTEQADLCERRPSWLNGQSSQDATTSITSQEGIEYQPQQTIWSQDTTTTINTTSEDCHEYHARLDLYVNSPRDGHKEARSRSCGQKSRRGSVKFSSSSNDVSANSQDLVKEWNICLDSHDEDGDKSLLDTSSSSCPPPNPSAITSSELDESKEQQRHRRQKRWTLRKELRQLHEEMLPKLDNKRERRERKLQEKDMGVGRERVNRAAKGEVRAAKGEVRSLVKKFEKVQETTE